MHEKLVEHWLTEVNELGYQLPFCEVLLAEGYSVLHVSTHGRGEHGKDIAARAPDGVLHTFQLKGGDINLSAWRAIRGEVEELVQLPVRIPGVREDEPHVPHLVTNGEIRGDAVESITRFAEDWSARGYPALQVQTRREVLRRFLDAHGRYLSSAATDFRHFVQLYAGDVEDRLPRAEFARLLFDMVRPDALGSEQREVRRGLASLAIMAGYVLEQYARIGNHIAAAEGWSIVAATIFHAVERDSIDPRWYEPVLTLVRTALERSLDAFESEVVASDDFVGRRIGIVDPIVYGIRVSLVLGWLSTAQHVRWLRNRPTERRDQVIAVVAREFRAFRTAGEVDWPAILSLALYLEREHNPAEAAAAFTLWANEVTAANRGTDPPGLPSPYWSHEQVVALVHGLVAPFEREEFAGQAYTLLSAADMLVRRDQREVIAELWPRMSRIHACDFVPDAAAHWFLWRTEHGDLRVTDPGPTASWSAWRSASAVTERWLIPATLLRHPEWLLPFVLTYPHRLTRALSAAIDALVGGCGAVAEHGADRAGTA